MIEAILGLTVLNTVLIRFEEKIRQESQQLCVF